MHYLLDGHKKRYVPLQTAIDDVQSYQTAVRSWSLFPGTQLALYVSNETLFLFDLKTGNTQKIEVLEEVRKVKCLSNDTFIVTNSRWAIIATIIAGEVKVKKRHQFDSYYSVREIDATKDGNRIVLSAYEQLIMISDGKLKKRTLTEQFCAAITPTGKYIATGDKEEMKIVDGASLKTVQTFKLEKLPIAMSFSSDGNTLIYGDDYANLYAYDLTTRQLLKYENERSSKTVYITWLEADKFLVVFLSGFVGFYTTGRPEAYDIIYLDEFDSRYFQHAGLIDKNTLSIYVEDLRTNRVVEGVPVSEVICLLNL